jgi:hypothetical protein
MTAAPTDRHIGLVVEGRGDLAAVPLLIRSHLHSTGYFPDILGKPVPFHGKGNATATGGIEGYVATAALRPGCLGVLVVLDADNEAACEQGPELLARALTAVGCPVVVALAERDYEDWLYSSVETLALAPGASFSESQRGKAVIAEMLAPKKYVKPTWQPRLTTRMDLHLARSRSTSLDRLLERFDELRAAVLP